MTETALARPKDNFTRIRDLARSDEVLSRFSEVLGPSAPAYISSVLTAVQSNDRLMECEPKSIILAAMRAATLRLSCDPGLGQAWLVPYRDNKRGVFQAQFQPGYKGYLQLAMRTGKYRFINVAPVWDGQTVEEDQMRGIHFIKGFRKDRDAKAIGFMLYFELTNGYSKTFYMTVPEILEHAERYSKTYDQPNGFWKKNTVDMMKKTVLRLGLTKWGYFDPNDAMNLADQPQGEMIDAEFEEMTDDDLPEQPTRTEAENLSQLGFDVSPAQPANNEPEKANEPDPAPAERVGNQYPAETLKAISVATKEPVNRIGNVLVYCTLTADTAPEAVVEWFGQYRKARENGKEVPVAAAIANQIF